ncbi:hypothetical protein [Kitasatospora sp. NPDC094011]|uniref:hypothetical protein n=1 Tax=Kitasatospora sp. NPDC094011 TaxID=3364090 RepID=UPI0037FD3930
MNRSVPVLLARPEAGTVAGQRTHCSDHMTETWRHSDVFAGWLSSQFLSVSQENAGRPECPVAVTVVTVAGTAGAAADDITAAEASRGAAMTVTNARRTQVDMTCLLARDRAALGHVFNYACLAAVDPADPTW